MIAFDPIFHDASSSTLLMDRPPTEGAGNGAIIGEKAPTSLHMPLPSEQKAHIASRFPIRVKLTPRSDPQDKSKMIDDRSRTVAPYDNAPAGIAPFEAGQTESAPAGAASLAPLSIITEEEMAGPEGEMPSYFLQSQPSGKKSEVRIASFQITNKENLPAFAWPIQGQELTSHFGPRWGKFHYGIDIISQSGDMEIKAAKTGRVIKSERTRGGYGNLIILDHGDGVYTYYAHLSKRYAKEGDLVRAGEVLGIMGDTGNTTGIHLHFEVRKDHEPLNPLDHLPAI